MVLRLVKHLFLIAEIEVSGILFPGSGESCNCGIFDLGDDFATVVVQFFEVC